MQCRYGTKILSLGKDGNAVFVKALSDVEGALQALYAAVAGGEFGEAVENMTISKKVKVLRASAGCPKRYICESFKTKILRALDGNS